MTYVDSAKKLERLREEMQRAGVDVFLVPRDDEFLCEAIAEYSERLSWLTGFTGSAGIALIGKDKACVMSDGRYTIQLTQQVDLETFEIANNQEVKITEWLSNNLNQDITIGYNPKLHTPESIHKIIEDGWVIKPVENLIDKIWENQPAAPVGQVMLFDEKFAGQSSEDKIKLLQDFLVHEKCDTVLLTQTDSIQWLLNVRGYDIVQNDNQPGNTLSPVVQSYLILPKDGSAQWFVDSHKISDELKEALEDKVDFLNISDLEKSIQQLTGQSIWYDPKRSSIHFKNLFEENNVEIREGDDPVIYPRACKNKIEQDAMKNAHIRDGVAMVRFLKWFDENSTSGKLDELIVEEQLESFRKKADEYKYPSFNTIAGFGSNGAIVHYRADKKSNQKIENGNLLLLDSGAQYIDGTTDITRTIAVGQPTDEMVKCNTLVLKGHIALATAKFKKGTLGKELDEMTRAPLVAEGLNYAHGTGHGVGCYLSVHEEAASISPRGEEAMAEGMIVSNEPGYYKKGEFGIRIENLILCQKKDDNLYFETITLAPFDKNLIDTSMLSDDEKEWVNNYHQTVFDKISPHLEVDEIEWLKHATLPI
ncbi:MAG: aminopeptidase P family protein [Pseudomonadota bacterium]